MSQTVGVISVPVIETHKIDSDDLFLVLASDGVWEFVPNALACKLVYDNLSDMDTATQKLVEEAHERWTKV